MRVSGRRVVAVLVVLFVLIGGGLLIARVVTSGCPGAGVSAFRCDEYALTEARMVGVGPPPRTRIWFEVLNDEPLAIVVIRTHALSVVLRPQGATTTSRGIETESLDGCAGGSVCEEQARLSRFFAGRLTWIALGRRLEVRSAAGSLVFRATGVRPPR